MERFGIHRDRAAALALRLRSRLAALPPEVRENACTTLYGEVTPPVEGRNGRTAPPAGSVNSNLGRDSSGAGTGTGAGSGS